MTSKRIQKLLPECVAIILVGLTLALASVWAKGSAEGRALEICQICRNAEKYRNRIITISGFYFRGPHGATIANESCGFRSRYRAFGLGAAAAVQYYDLSAPSPRDNPDLVDKGSIWKFDAAVAKAIKESSWNDPVIKVTFVGFVGIAEHFSINGQDDDYAGTGHGFMGRYPVQITIYSVKSFAISAPHKRGN